jgi:hypothetical protein
MIIIPSMTIHYPKITRTDPGTVPSDLCAMPKVPSKSPMRQSPDATWRLPLEISAIWVRLKMANQSDLGVPYETNPFKVYPCGPMCHVFFNTHDLRSDRNLWFLRLEVFHKSV